MAGAEVPGGGGVFGVAVGGGGAGGPGGGAGVSERCVRDRDGVVGARAAGAREGDRARDRPASGASMVRAADRHRHPAVRRSDHRYAGAAGAAPADGGAGVRAAAAGGDRGGGGGAGGGAAARGVGGDGGSPRGGGGGGV